MTTSRSNIATSWEEYETGRSPRQGSTGSIGSRVHFHTPQTSGGPHDFLSPGGPSHDDRHSADGLRRQTSRSSMSIRFNSFANAGGVNSLENFARSWSRAAGFTEIPQRKPSFVVPEDEESSVGSKKSGQFPPVAESRSLLRQQLEQQGNISENVIEEGSRPPKQDEESQNLRPADHSSPRESGNFLERSGHHASPFSSSYGGVYGSLQPRSNESLIRRSIVHHWEEDDDGAKMPEQEQEPLLVKVVEQKDGRRIQVVVGQSTLPQTVFNSVNVLIGVGLLSLPLGLKQSGWLIGMVFLLLAALVTRYTARLLAKCLDLDHSLVTFSDIAWKAFGLKARVAVGVLFSIELLAACVALVVLFADSLDALIPGWEITGWKIVCGLILVPLSFVPLRFLSFTSVLGILSCLGIVTLIFVDGLTKPHSPGSLLEPAPSALNLYPTRWSDLPLSLGLLMSPWGGHSVFPSIYRDMRHPTRYPKAINITYVFTYLIDVAIAVAGYLMFGRHILDEVTSNILRIKDYSHVIAICIVVFIAIIPITKVPLNARPIFIIFEDYFSLSSHRPPADLPKRSMYVRKLCRAMLRLLVLILIVVLAILVPSFDTVMSLMGSAMAFSICIILPMAFHLKLFDERLGRVEKALGRALIVLCSVLAIIGTVWVFLPKSLRYRLDAMIP